MSAENERVFLGKVRGSGAAGEGGVVEAVRAGRLHRGFFKSWSRACGVRGSHGAGQGAGGLLRGQVAMAMVRRPGWAIREKFLNGAVLCRGPIKIPSKCARAVL